MVDDMLMFWNDPESQDGTMQSSIVQSQYSPALVTLYYEQVMMQEGMLLTKNPWLIPYAEDITNSE